MLTKDLLEYRVRLGRVRPVFVDRSDLELLELAEEILDVALGSTGLERGVIEDALKALEVGRRPKRVRGLAKLVLDRMDFGDPPADVPAFRSDVQLRAAEILRALEGGATFESYESRLGEAFGELGPVRESLFADLDEYRRLVAFDAIEPPDLLDRYNLAQVQGLLFFADRVTIDAKGPDLLEVRRLLRHLKFCRLVADLHRDGGWRLVVEGPGAVVSMQKKYGLQLASFFAMVPILSSYRMTAIVRPPHRGESVLEISDEDALVPIDSRTGGYIPEEIADFASDLGEWTVDAAPDVRNVGASDVAVPDFTLNRGEVSVAVELFHRWHKGTLLRRLEALRVKPDPNLVLGVDRALLDDELSAQVDSSEQVFLFSAVPSKRALLRVLSRFECPGSVGE